MDERLKRVAAALPIPAHATLLEDRVADELLRHATDNGTDLVVLTTHGRSGLPHLFLGSVADQVLRGASIPILLHRPVAGEVT